MTLPKPSRVRAALEELGCPEYGDDYEWAYRSLGYHPRVGDSAGHRAPGESRPTESVALDTKSMKLRGELVTFARLLDGAVANKRGAVAALQRAFAVENGPEARLTGSWAAPSQVTPNELEEARRAKQRRVQRGESWGDS